MTFIFACIYAMSNVHFLCRSGSVGIISFLSEKFFYHFLKYGFGWQCFSSNFYILKKYSFFFLFFKDIFVDYRILSRLLFLPPPCYPFKDVTPLSSDLHSFQGEVCCHCCLFASVWWYLFSQSASKSASLVFSS